MLDCLWPGPLDSGRGGAASVTWNSTVATDARESGRNLALGIGSGWWGDEERAGWECVFELVEL